MAPPGGGWTGRAPRGQRARDHQHVGAAAHQVLPAAAVQDVVAAVAAELIALDPGSRALYERNAAAYRATPNLLAARANGVLSREALAEILGMDESGERAIDVQVTRLRRKIEADPKDPQLIKTVRGGGYVFSAEVASGVGKA